MVSINLAALLEASVAGGPSCYTSVTELAPAAGPHAAVAPAKFASRGKREGVYAYERRYLDGEPADAVVIDSKQSQLNRIEAAINAAIADDHPVLSRIPRIRVTYEREGEVEIYSDLSLPHRAFDAHIRAGSVDGTPVTQLDAYRAIRNANPTNARALLDASPVSLVFGSWDSSRPSRQGRWRSVLVGEVIGFCIDSEPGRKGGARTDPVGMQIKLPPNIFKALLDEQRAELSGALATKIETEIANAKKRPNELVRTSTLGLGGVPPSLESLAGVACRRIVRSHVLNFAALRQIRFGGTPQSDAACRALLAALALDGLARSDAELSLRANCDLREAGPALVELDRRSGAADHLDALSVEAADALLVDALDHAEKVAGVVWAGPVLDVVGNHLIVAGAADDESDEGAGA